MQAELPWWEISLSHPELDHASYLLFELGAKAVEQTGDQTARCFVQSQKGDLDQLEQRIAALGFKIVGIDLVPNQDWVAQAQTHWQALCVGKLTVLPLDEHSARAHATTKDQILIVPGMGFGTGQHDTTAMVLELMQCASCKKALEGPILDLGTGSGVLAIALSKLGGKGILAIDHDSQAIENAKLNVELNRLQDQIELRVTTLDQVLKRGPFALIVANITAEILCELEPLFRQALSPGGLLLISGIMLKKSGEIDCAFVSSRWQQLELRNSEYWQARVLSVSARL